MQSVNGHSCKYRKKWSDSKAVRKKEELEQLQRHKEEEEKECKEKFGRVLDSCRRLISKTVESGGDILDLLDPLVCDFQCQLHGVLMCNTLRKFNNSHTYSHCDIEMLEDKDKEILSHGVLLSLLKTEYRDKLGFVVKDMLTTDFNGMMLGAKRRERHYINEAKVKFNSYSVDFIRSFARGSLREILNECEAICHRSHLKLLPLYGTISAVINYVEREKLPMVVSILQYVRQEEGEDATYSLCHDETRYYEFREEKEEFFYKPELSDSEKEKPTIVFACYSLTNGGIEEIPTDYQTVRNLLMSWAAGRRQLPKTAVFPSQYVEGDDYVRGLYEQHTDIFNEYNEHYEFAKTINIIDACYAKVKQTSHQLQEDNSSMMTLAVERGDKDIFFAIDHIFLSSYSRESQYQENLDASKAYQNEVLEIKETKMVLSELQFSNL